MGTDKEIGAAQSHAQPAVNLIPAVHSDERTYVLNLMHIRSSGPSHAEPPKTKQNEAPTTKDWLTETVGVVKDFQTSQSGPSMEAKSHSTSLPPASLSKTANPQDPKHESSGGWCM